MWARPEGVHLGSRAWAQAGGRARHVPISHGVLHSLKGSSRARSCLVDGAQSNQSLARVGILGKGDDALPGPQVAAGAGRWPTRGREHCFTNINLNMR